MFLRKVWRYPRGSQKGDNITAKRKRSTNDLQNITHKKIISPLFTLNRSMSEIRGFSFFKILNLTLLVHFRSIFIFWNFCHFSTDLVLTPNILGTNLEWQEQTSKVKLDLYFINLNVATKYWWNRLGNKKLQNKQWWPSWIIDNFGRGPSKVYFDQIWFHSSDSVEDFQFFNQSEVMPALLEVGQGHQTQFWKRTIKKESHPSLVQFNPVVLEKIKMWKVERQQMPGDGLKAHLNL